jgi:hypothetical protein
MIPNGHITVYNKYIDPTTRTEKYKRSEIYNVVWQGSKAVTSARNQTAANSALILIPFASGTGYALPKIWQADSLHTGWTLQEGDIIARGMVNQNITTEYGVTQLKANYEDVVMVASVDAMDQGSANVRHWEVGCK